MSSSNSSASSSSKIMNTFLLPSKIFRNKHGFSATNASIILGLLRATILPEELRAIIYSKIRANRALEPTNGPLQGKSSLARRRRAQRLNVCHRCAKWTCDSSNPNCANRGIASINQHNKLKWIKGGLSTLLPEVETPPIVYNEQMMLYIDGEISRLGLEQVLESDLKRPPISVWGWSPDYPILSSLG